MRFTSSCALLIPVLLLVHGCSKPRFIYELDGTFRSTQYRTMAADPRLDRVVIREGLRPIDSGLHRRAVLAELEARNYQPFPAAEADLWVAVYTLAEAQPEARKGDSSKAAHREGSGEGRHGGGRGAKGGGGSPMSVKGDSSGWSPRGRLTVIVQLHDRKTGLPVWQGEANLDPKDRAANGGPMTPDEAMRQLLKPLSTRP